jgi:hypothetical protein
MQQLQRWLLRQYVSGKGMHLPEWISTDRTRLHHRWSYRMQQLQRWLLRQYLSDFDYAFTEKKNIERKYGI